MPQRGHKLSHTDSLRHRPAVTGNTSTLLVRGRNSARSRLRSPLAPGVESPSPPPHHRHTHRETPRRDRELSSPGIAYRRNDPAGSLLCFPSPRSASPAASTPPPCHCPHSLPLGQASRCRRRGRSPESRFLRCAAPKLSHSPQAALTELDGKSIPWRPKMSPLISVDFGYEVCISSYIVS
ncbi:hypothetical protein MARPO_0005s0154 [Marchantia polymorpha]|uniref:Uncharacterized protein n=1 Tax=Marchantia polymorpha TaxID=3197 RepID=A0A2R6XQZ1_MARPO|nr:hypothetical protein MARPO_0005s0154 [Marchantia polymorpha]|eukprot:PTQ48514.1 hypothetical protein MARPO_0005s0154 [Marchantia polymorpha]